MANFEPVSEECGNVCISSSRMYLAIFALVQKEEMWQCLHHVKGKECGDVCTS